MGSEKGEHVPAAGDFVIASSTSEWYGHLQPRGSCLRLLSLLAKQRTLIHELGPKGITALHKGVEHGCVRLVKFILVNMFDDEGNCTCRVHGPGIKRLTREKLLRKACEDDITAVQMAVVSGSPKMVLLLNWAIDKVEQEKKSSKGDEVTGSDDTRVYRQRITFRSSGNVVLVTKGAWEMEGDDMRLLFEDGNIEDSEYTVETVWEGMNDTESNSLVVPDVRDDTIDCVYPSDCKESVMIPKLFDIIECILEDPDCFTGDEWKQRWIKYVKEMCKKDVDYEFVPVAHVIVHFLLSTVTEFTDWCPGVMHSIVQKFLEKIIRACNEHDLKEQGNLEGGDSMLATLFKILDPRGRTILHAILGHIDGSHIIFYFFEWMEKLNLRGTSFELRKECMNSKDGAGRTILHLMCTLDTFNSPWFEFLGIQRKWDVNILDWNAKLAPLSSMASLVKWCNPLHRKKCPHKPIHLAILFDSISTFNYLYSRCKTSSLKANRIFKDSEDDSVDFYNRFELLQQAAFLGRSKIIETILEQPNIKPIKDTGIDSCPQAFGSYPAIHCAALSVQVEAIQSLLKFSIYDPLIQHLDWSSEGTALHFLLKKKKCNTYVKMFQTLALLHVLPNSKQCVRLKDEFSKLYFDEHKPKMFSTREISCINLLLQAGIDIWTPHYQTKELPSPGPMANDEARKWWHDKVASEVVRQKTSINDASNATSVIATLVATASFIGPLQPPLGLADDGFLHTGQSAVRVYFVCNGLSFYFSIASILMAVMPAIPMPKESLYDELFRSQRSLKSAVLLLLVAIICILTSFTSASIAVVSTERHDMQLVGAYVAVGGIICVIVLVVYMIRMLRMVFHKNDRFRRWFANNMGF